jgi:opacity protein-like surface antigen
MAGISFAGAVWAGDLDLENPRLLRGPEPSYEVLQSSTQAWHLRGSASYERNYEVVQAPAQTQNVGAYRSAIVGPALPVVIDPPPPYDWTGFYGGLNLGAAWGSYQPSTSTGPGAYFGPTAIFSTAVSNAGVQSIRPAGFIGGEQVGYNWQSGQLVAGLEAGLNFLHLSAAANAGAVLYSGLGGPQFVVSSYAHSDWLLTLQPRIGLASDGQLFYVTGGSAVSNVKGDFLFTDSFGARQSATINNTEVGYAVGAGVEWAVTDLCA